MKEIEIKTMEQLAEYINEFIDEYENDSVLDKAESIALRNGWTLGEKLPLVCYDEKERLMYENGEAEVYKKMKPEEVTTLERFADYINEREGWDNTMWEIMERNGWDETDDPNDVCQSDTELLIFGDNGAYVVPATVAIISSSAVTTPMMCMYMMRIALKRRRSGFPMRPKDLSRWTTNKTALMMYSTPPRCVTMRFILVTW